MSGLAALVERASIVVCCGTGGVGKTTTAAAVALEGARRGRKTMVVTIDPAKRLADALGLRELSNDPQRIDRDRWDPDNTAQSGGELSALMLDVKHTFDALIARYSSSPEQAERITNNSFYRNLSTALSGTQEYMAMEKLYELNESYSFDLIVVDTPPSRHALDFLDAPNRLLRLLDNRIFRLLMSSAGTSLRIAGAAVQRFLRTVARAAGPEVINDVVAFLQAFDGMEAGFRERAAHVVELVHDEGTRFVLVTSPRRDAIDEVVFFAERLRTSGHQVDALVVNRVHPAFGADDPELLRKRGARCTDASVAQHLANLADFRTVAVAERTRCADLAGRINATESVLVPFLPDDVHDLGALNAVAQLLTDTSAPDPNHGSTAH
ncbi:MAG: ArsA family ATPase [Acidimicrobiia bacterium]